MSPVLGRTRLAALAAAIASASALGTGAAPAAAQAPVNPGEITGKVTGSRPAPSKGVVVVRAMNAATGAIADVATVSRRGTYTLVVPPGAYGVRATIVAPGRRGGDATIPVTVAENQKRAGVTFRAQSSGTIARAAKARAASQPTATRAYVSTDGSEVAGVTAYSVEPLKGARGDWAGVGKALPAFLQTELHDATSCPTVGIVNASERRYVERSLKFRTGRVVSRGTRVQRNLIVADLAVNGSLSGSGSRASASFAVIDKRTGKVLDSFEGTLRKSRFSSDTRRFAKLIAERLCRTPPAYELTLSVNGKVDVQSHTATGRLDAVMTAKQTGGTGGQPDATWRADGKLAWSQIAYQNKTSDKCPYINVVPAAGTWVALLAVINGQLTVDWGTSAEFYVAFTTATLQCPGQAPVTNQPGPAFTGILPNAQRLPLTGGVLAVSGALNVGGQAVNNTGTLTVKPVWSTDAP
ncbi:MAG: hypothetical protein JHD16_19140 [Solirubrobacteraceae bacterium]|nr:hypothetical protein [Solirubrobacteraceae bacterium]